MVVAAIAVLIAGIVVILREPSTPSAGGRSDEPPSSSATVVVGREGVLGWWDGSTWVQWEPGLDVPLRGGEQYVTLTIATRGPAVGTAPREHSRRGCGSGIPLPPEVGLTGEDGASDRPPLAITGPALAVGGRPAAEELSPEGAEYRAIASEALADIGIDDTDPPLAQVVRVDVESDGADEVFLVAERISGALGDYSVLVFRRLVNGAVTTEVVHRFVASDAEEAGRVLVSQARIVAVVDINGDGVVEAAVTYQLGESSATTVLDLSGPAPAQVLQAECPN